MFKELGEFIDNVGRTTGIVVKRLLSEGDKSRVGDSDNEELPTMGCLPEELEKFLNGEDIEE